MKTKNIILFFCFLVVFSLLNGYSQENVIKPDSVQQKKTGTGMAVQKQEQDQKQIQIQKRIQSQGEKSQEQQGNSPDKNPTQQVKQVKSAKPDMSKARGARPPEIVRPSGAPKGVGRPGGVMRRGGR